MTSALIQGWSWETAHLCPLFRHGSPLLSGLESVAALRAGLSRAQGRQGRWAGTRESPHGSESQGLGQWGAQLTLVFLGISRFSTGNPVSREHQERSHPSKQAWNILPFSRLSGVGGEGGWRAVPSQHGQHAPGQPHRVKGRDRA